MNQQVFNITPKQGVREFARVGVEDRFILGWGERISVGYFDDHCQVISEQNRAL